ncbi:MAG: cadmium-translocating P-type ATPase [Chitinophagia bacterium]|jgi:Cu+-exporting ATPase|nr:cadmium-translocating P-type ATPase [Chitinophagia bacterium]
MEEVQWKVDGMSCTNCALSIHKYLQSKGIEDPKVNFMEGEVQFQLPQNIDKDTLAKGIHHLGYKVRGNEEAVPVKKWLDTQGERAAFCFIFTLPLLIHMLPGVHIHWMMNPYVQLALTIPVFIVGMSYFGRSAWKSIITGIPNMNVLVAIGAIASFGYSLYGTLIGQGQSFAYYETTATIITLVFFGNYLEDSSVQSTQRALKDLVKAQKVMANMIVFDDQHKEVIFNVESSTLKVGDLILINSGETVPMDCKILWGEANVNESIVTGESVPVHRTIKDSLLGGSTIENGTLKAYVTAVGDDTVLANILKMVKAAQGEKPPVQILADKISAIFVPLVLSISIITLIGNYYFTSIGFGESMLRAIAVLVISCPCAMGLATPAAIAVGLGRGARNGVLFKNAKSLETFKDIKQVVFDKTGTLTTGHFTIAAFKVLQDMQEEAFKNLVYSLEKYSNHPIAKCISTEWKSNQPISWKTIEEIKGLGIKAIDNEGNEYWTGSYKLITKEETDKSHNIFILKNNILLGWLDVEDEIREEAKNVIHTLHLLGIHTILLSGDQHTKCEKVGKALGIQEIISEQSPADKLAKLEALTLQSPTAMVGDGINDAPALAKATIGISLSNASHIAIQSAQVILMNQGLKNLPMALGLGRRTYETIKENLVWAFSYNIVAIPVAALGLLGTWGPTYGALIMALSDVVLAINSLRLFRKKLE